MIEGKSPIGNAWLQAIPWRRKIGVRRAIITRRGSEIVSDETRALAEITALGEDRGVSVQIAHDGLDRRI